MPRRKKNCGTTAPQEQLRLNLCFNANDPMERTVYNMLQAPEFKKLKSHLVASAIIGMMYISPNGEFTQHTIEDIIQQTVHSCISNAGPIFVHENPPVSKAEDTKENDGQALSDAQMDALDAIIGNFM